MAKSLFEHAINLLTDTLLLGEGINHPNITVPGKSYSRDHVPLAQLWRLSCIGAGLLA